MAVSARVRRQVVAMAIVVVTVVSVVVTAATAVDEAAVAMATAVAVVASAVSVVQWVLAAAPVVPVASAVKVATGSVPQSAAGKIGDAGGFAPCQSPGAQLLAGVWGCPPSFSPSPPQAASRKTLPCKGLGTPRPILSAI